MSDFLQDLRYALRMMIRNPGFTLAAILTMGLGIGANTAIFSVVNGVLLRPLPLPRPERLMTAWMERYDGTGGENPFSESDYLDWKAQSRSFAHLAAFTDTISVLTGQGRPQRLHMASVTREFFDALEAPPLLGRSFLPGDDDAGKPRLVILSHALWRERFGSDPKIVGKTLRMGDVPRTVAGVMPPDFRFPAGAKGILPGRVDLWSLMPAFAPTRRGPYYLWGLGRLREGVAPAQARAETQAIGARVAKDHPLDNLGVIYGAQSLKDYLVEGARRPLWVLFGAVVLVLLIASANVANLMLTRTAAREREIAIRCALGAGRGRIVRQWLTESLVFAGLGGALGLLLADWGTAALLKLSPVQLPRLHEVRVDGSVLAFTLLAALASGLLAAAGSLLQSARPRLYASLKERAQAGEGKSHRRTRSLLVVGELALSVMLLVGAALMILSLLRLQKVSPGFNPEQIVTAALELPGGRYDTDEKVNAFYTRLLEKVEALPGMRSAGIGISLPPSTLSITDTFTVEGKPQPPGGAPMAAVLFVSPGYFTALGVPVLRGRNFDDSDRPGAPMSVIINDTLARSYFPGLDPVGKRIKIGGDERPKAPWMTVVGVVGDVRFNGLDEAPVPTYYESYQQVAWWGTYLVARSSLDPRTLVKSIQGAVASLDPDLPLGDVKTMDDLMAESVAETRFLTLLLGLFGGLALLLAAVGVYGVISYRVALRTNEIGVRMALGARPLDVVKMVLRQGMSLIAAGVALGLAGALALSRVLQGLVFGVSTTDPLTLAGVVLMLAAVAAIACYVPARRAARVDPMTALRYE